MAEHETLYRILEGVHRCVAAHLTGQTDISARVDCDGVLGPVCRVSLTVIYSPKPEIGRWDHNRDFHVLLGLMADEAERDRIPAVELTPVSARVAKYLTHVTEVIVRDG